MVKINTLLMWFFCILLSSSIRAKDVKEGDRMEHRDDVLGDDCMCKCQYKNAQKVENKNVHFPTILPRIVLPKRLSFL